MRHTLRRDIISKLSAGGNVESRNTRRRSRIKYNIQTVYGVGQTSYRNITMLLSLQKQKWRAVAHQLKDW